VGEEGERRGGGGRGPALPLQGPHLTPPPPTPASVVTEVGQAVTSLFSASRKLQALQEAAGAPRTPNKPQHLATTSPFPSAPSAVAPAATWLGR
jgi:hypothetical protein